MVWYASEILFEASDKAIAFVEENKALKDHAYLLKNPIKHDWHQPGIEHSVSKDGLIAIRPICSATHWHAHDWFSYSANHYNEGNVLEPLDLEIVRIASKEKPIGSFATPVGFPAEKVDDTYSALVLADLISEFTRDSVVFYQAASSGEPFDWELAWIFGKNERIIMQGWEEETASEFRNGKPTLYSGNMLVSALQELRCNQPTGYFAPHTRSFPWADYKFPNPVRP